MSKSTPLGTSVVQNSEIATVRKILMRLSSAALFFVLFSSVLSSASAQDNCTPDYMCKREPKKIALVIGNANYMNLAPIPSALVDAKTMQQRLKDVGFEVDFHTDVKSVFEFEQEILPGFRQKLTTGDFIVFYFSGHGFAHGADNFVAPTELPLSMTAQTVTAQAIPIDAFKGLLETYSPALILFIIDACRSIGSLEINNNQNENLIPKGPTPMLNRNTAINAVIAYATEPGHVAIGTVQPGRMSPFTDALTVYLPAEGEPFSKVFEKAAADLVASTAPPQVPGTFNWSRTDPYLKPTVRNLEEQEEAWRSTLLSPTPKSVRVFLQRYSISRYLIAARKWLADHPDNDLASGFTRVSPIAIDRAWRSTNSEMVAIRRLSVPLGFVRSQSEIQEPGLRELSDTEMGLVRSGTKPSQLAEVRTGEEFVASISPRAELRTEFYRNSLAYSLANIDAHGTVVATRPLVGHSAPNVGAAVIERVSPKTVLQIKNISLAPDESIWIEATGAGNRSSFFFKLEPGSTPAVLELGRSARELMVPARPGSLPELVDPAPITAALTELKAQGWKITWISLSTAPTTDETEQETRAARMANAVYILRHADIPLFISKGTSADIGDRITSVSGREDFSGDGVRIRFFGIK